MEERAWWENVGVNNRNKRECESGKEKIGGRGSRRERKRNSGVGEKLK